MGQLAPMQFPGPSIKTEIQEQLGNNDLCGPPAQNVEGGSASLLMSAAQSLATVASGEATAQPNVPGHFPTIPVGGGRELSALGMGGPASAVGSFPTNGASQPSRKRKSQKESQRSTKKASRAGSGTAASGSESSSPKTAKGKGRSRERKEVLPDGIILSDTTADVWAKLPQRHTTTLTWQLAWDMLTHTEFKGAGERPKTLRASQAEPVEATVDRAYGTIYAEHDPGLHDAALRLAVGPQQALVPQEQLDTWEVTVGRKGVHLHKTPDGRFGVVRKVGFVKVMAPPAVGGFSAGSNYISIKYHEYTKVSFDTVGGGGGTWANIDVSQRGGKQVDSRTVFHIIVPNNRGKSTSRLQPVGSAPRNVGPPQGAPVRLLEDDGTLTVRAGRGMSPSLQAATAKYAAARAKADAAYKERAASANLARLQQLEAQEEKKRQQEQRDASELAKRASKTSSANGAGLGCSAEDAAAAAIAARLSSPSRVKGTANSAEAALSSTSGRAQGIPESILMETAGKPASTWQQPASGAIGCQPEASEASTTPRVPILDREAAIKAAKKFYNEDGPFAKTYTMQVVAAYQNSSTQWSIEYTTSPPTATHLVQFVYELIEPKNRSLGKLALRLEGLPASYYWHWKAVSMSEGAGTRVEVKAKSPRAARTRTAKASKEGEGTRRKTDSNSPQSQAGTPSVTLSALV
jgi:hypothetical protein